MPSNLLPPPGDPSPTRVVFDVVKATRLALTAAEIHVRLPRRMQAAMTEDDLKAAMVVCVHHGDLEWSYPVKDDPEPRVAYVAGDPKP